MSDDPSAWWNFTTEQSVRMILDYMPVKSCAVIVSSLSVRALGELQDDLEGQALEDRHNKEWTNVEPRPDFMHTVQFQRDEAHPNYPLCIINVQDIKQVQVLLWWLQRTQPGAIQLQHVEKLSADELRQVLDVLFSDEPVLPHCVPLFTNLLELSVDNDSYYKCTTNMLETLGRCTGLKKLNLSWCKSLDGLNGLESLVGLEELDIRHTPISDLRWLCRCQHLTRLRTVKLCHCGSVATLAGVANLPNLEYISLAYSGVTSLAGLERCTSIRIVDLEWCIGLMDFDQLRHLPHLEVVVLANTHVKDVSFLRGSDRLAKLNLNYTQVEDLTPLQSCKALKEIKLTHCKGVDHIEALRDILMLENLEMVGTSVRSIEPLGACTQLTALNVGGCIDLESIAALKHMSKLEELNLCNTAVRDLTPLAGCVQLKTLVLYGCKGVHDFSVLQNMACLQRVWIPRQKKEQVATAGFSERILKCIVFCSM